MWAALRSDLKEFVSTVAEDTSTVLTKIDANLDGEEDEGQESTEQQEEGDDDDEQADGSPREPLLSSSSNTASTMSPTTTTQKKDSQVFVDTDGNVIAANFASTGIIASPADEAARLASHEETYLEPLHVDSDEDFVELKDFLANFQIDAKTEEIAQLLQDHWEIQQHFENLVPTLVKYEDFWQRYYFRCDEERIAKRWQAEQEQNRQARAAAFTGGLMSVRSLFGGALSSVMAVSSGTSRDQQEEDGDDGNEPVAPSPFHNHGTASSGSTFGLNLFGASGRPPFVMNTAVDESFDDQPTPKAEEEPEEEELGWDDEEEEEEDDDDGAGHHDDDDDDDQVEEIEFKDDAKEQLQKLLAQAISERDSLHETVELQRNEIATLKLSGVGTKDLEQLKMELFEKDSELAALKASLEDTHDDDGTNGPNANKKDAAKAALQERDLERLSNELSERECELLEVKHQLRQAKAELEEQGTELQSTKAALEETRASNAELQSKVVELDEALAAAQEQSTAASTEASSATKLAATEQELLAARTLSEQLALRVEELSLQLETSNKKAAEMEKQLNAVVETPAPSPSVVDSVTPPPPPPVPAKVVAPAKVERAVNVSPDSSTSTTVKIPLPLPTETAEPPAVGAEDDWGDDWGDDDDN